MSQRLAVYIKEDIQSQALVGNTYISENSISIAKPVKTVKYRKETVFYIWKYIVSRWNVT